MGRILILLPMDQPATPFRLSLKRTKHTFQPTTAAFSDSSHNMHHSQPSSQPSCQYSSQYSSYFPQTKSQREGGLLPSEGKTIRQNKQNIIQGQHSLGYKTLQQKILSLSGPSGKQKTRSYVRANSSLHRSEEQEVPDEVLGLYEKEREKSQNVHFQKGYLRDIGFRYFAVGRNLVLLSFSTYFKQLSEQTQMILIEDLDEPVLAVKEIVIDKVDKASLESHPFAQFEVILIFSHSWKLTFHSFHTLPSLQIRGLNITIPMYSAAAFLFESSSNGDIYYLDSQGSVGRVCLQGGIGWSKKYSLKNHLFLNKAGMERKKEEVLRNPSILKSIGDQFEDVRYFLKKKHLKAISLKIDKSRHILYTLIEARLEDKEKAGPHREIRMYDISEREDQHGDKGLLHQLNQYLNNQQPVLIARLSEQELFSSICSHLLAYTQLRRFRIMGMEPVEGRTAGYRQTNLIIILSNGSRLHLFLDAKNVILNELVNLPDLNRLSRDPEHPSSIPQAEPAFLDLLTYTLEGGIYITSFKHCRKIMTLMMSSISPHQETVHILALTDIPTTNSNIFLDTSKFWVLSGSQLAPHRSKISLSPLPVELSSSPLFHQVFYSPSQHLICTDGELTGIVSLRPIDVLLSRLSKPVHDLWNVLEGMKDAYEGEINCEELVCMLMQVYCDQEGTYIRPMNMGNLSAKDINKRRDSLSYIRITFAHILEAQPSLVSIAERIQQLLRTYFERNPQKFAKIFLLYPSRILSRVWGLQIRCISEPTLNYLLALLSRFEELVRGVCGGQRVRAESPVEQGNEEQGMKKVKQIWDLMAKLIQYVQMLVRVSRTSLRMSLPFGEGLAADFEDFEECIFSSMLQHSKHAISLSSLLAEWSKSFPSYFTPNLLQTLRLTIEVAGMEETENTQLLQVLKKKGGLVSQYLLKHLYLERKIGRKDFEALAQQVSTTPELKNRVGHILANEYSTPLQKVMYGMEQAESHSSELEEKKYFLNYAYQNLPHATNINTNQLRVYQQELEHKKKLLSIQIMLKKEVERLTSKGEHIGANTLFLISHVLLTHTQLKSLLSHFKAPALLLPFLCTFGATTPEIEAILHEFIFGGEELKPGKAVKEELDQVFLKCPNRLTSVIPPSVIACELDKVAINDMKQKDVAKLVRKMGNNKSSPDFWVGCYLADWGWDPMSLLDYYQHMMEQVIKVEYMHFLYYLATAYTLVKNVYRDGRRLFQINSLSLLEMNKELANRQREGKWELVYSLLEQLRL